MTWRCRANVGRPIDWSTASAEPTKKLKYLKKPRKQRFTATLTATHRLAPARVGSRLIGHVPVDGRRDQEETEKVPVPARVEEVARQQQHVLSAMRQSVVEDQNGYEERGEAPGVKSMISLARLVLEELATLIGRAF